MSGIPDAVKKLAEMATQAMQGTPFREVPTCTVEVTTWERMPIQFNGPDMQTMPEGERNAYQMNRANNPKREVYVIRDAQTHQITGYYFHQPTARGSFYSYVGSTSSPDLILVPSQAATGDQPAVAAHLSVCGAPQEGNYLPFADDTNPAKTLFISTQGSMQVDASRYNSTGRWRITPSYGDGTVDVRFGAETCGVTVVDIRESLQKADPGSANGGTRVHLSPNQARTMHVEKDYDDALPALAFGNRNFLSVAATDADVPRMAVVVNNAPAQSFFPPPSSDIAGLEAIARRIQPVGTTAATPPAPQSQGPVR